MLYVSITSFLEALVFGNFKPNFVKTFQKKVTFFLVLVTVFNEALITKQCSHVGFLKKQTLFWIARYKKCHLSSQAMT